MTTLAIAGNPNCGKSALFNNLTGIRQTTGNWPGVTVERKLGSFNLSPENKVTVIDLPGIYTLDAMSLDEQVTRSYLLSREADVVINVLDAANLERNLYLTVQLLEMGVPVVLALNMMDIAQKRGISIDIDLLSKKLGCPVICIVAVTGKGINDLKQAALQVIEDHSRGGFSLTMDAEVETAIADIRPHLPEESHTYNTYWIALKLLEGDTSVCRQQPDAELSLRIQKWQQHIQNITTESADIYIADSRFGHAHTITQLVVKVKGKVHKYLSDRIDQVVLHHYFGVPIFMLVMYLMFMFTINFGGAFIDFFDGVAGAIFVDGLASILTSIGLPDLAVLILAQGLGGGIQVVATFIPIITCLYLFLSFLEDSGYMARAAFVMDRFMRAIGLPGKAFVPMIVGFGCNVPAVMATRTLESERERKLTILMNPFMSCGARLPVYVLFAAAFFPSNGQNLVFALYLIGILMAIATGLVMKHSLLSGESSGFLMEMPTYHVPTLKGIGLRTWDRVKLFIRDAGRIIIIMVLALNVLNSIGTDGSIGNEDSENSVLSVVGKSLTPLFEPMGIEKENWPATVGIFTGILAKEVVVGTLNSIYTQISLEGIEQQEQTYDLFQSLSDAVATIPQNLSGLTDFLFDPLGLDVGDLNNSDSMAEDLEVTKGIFGVMSERFDGQAGAFSYLLFILLYFPCVATIGAIAKEAGRAWAIFVAFWSTSVAYITAVLFYQFSRFSVDPFYASVTIALIIIYTLLLFMGLRSYANKQQTAVVQTS
ncbi:MAG: Fe(2+) transporter permease subunit FeoB [Gammaproteobacteria bacterium]|jgi:ferrous iron transport protein B|nr:Fe(2+) transporter permease subunit FeoB [Gammaproteobacteria bacterium]